MNKMLKKLTSAVFASMMFACVNAFAASDNGYVMENLTKNTQNNPIVKSVRYKFPDASKKPALEGLNGYYYLPSGADATTYKDGSHYWLVVFARNDNNCNGDFIFEHDVSTNRSRVTEFCRIHGKQEKSLQYLEDFKFIKAFCEKQCVAKPIKYAGYNGVETTNGPVKIENLGYTWIKSTADTGYYYDEKTLRVNAAKRTVSVDACVWQPAKNMYTVLGGWTFDYNKMVSYPAWYKEVRISDGVTIKKVDGGKFGKAPFNLDNDNKVYEDFLYKFVK